MSLLSDVQAAVSDAFTAVSSLLQTITFERNSSEDSDYNTELGQRILDVSTCSVQALVESYSVESASMGALLQPGDLRITAQQTSFVIDSVAVEPSLEDWLVYDGERYSIVSVAAGDPANTLWVITARKG